MTVCGECSQGIHKHMDAKSEPWFEALEEHGKRDVLDCKNIITRFDQCVCPLWQAYMEELDESARRRFYGHRR